MEKVLFKGSLIVTILMLHVNIVMADTVLNVERGGRQSLPSIALLSNGNVAVAWFSESFMETAPRYNVFTPALSPILEYEHFVPQYGSLGLGWSKLAASEDGFFIGGFARSYSDNENSIDVFIRKFDNNGNPLTGDIRVNSDTLGNQWIVAILIDDSTDLIIAVWGKVLQSNPYQKHFYMRQLDFNLDYLSEDILVYDGYDENINKFTAELMSSTKLIAVWEREYNIVEEYEIVARYLDIDGSNPSEPFRIHTYGDIYGDFFSPNIIRIASGSILIVWSAIFDQYEASTWARRFDSTGEPIDSVEVLMSEPDIDGNGFSLLQQNPYATYNAENDVVALCWDQDNGNYMAEFNVMGRFFNGNLEPLSDTILINESEVGGGLLHPVNTFVGTDSILTCWDGIVNDDFGEDIIASVIQIPQTGIEKPDTILPVLFSTAYPNPFNEQIRVSYSLHLADNVNISIFNINGQLVSTILSDFQSVGNHEVIWDASNVASGIYFCRIENGGLIETKKVTLLR